MKRITVAVTLSNASYYGPKHVRTAMINAACAAATEKGEEIAGIVAKVGTVRDLSLRT